MINDLHSSLSRIFLTNKTEVDRAFWSAFARHFDMDGSGSINRIEFGAMIGAIHPSLTEEQISEMVPLLLPLLPDSLSNPSLQFAKADVDLNGDISFDEAYALFSADSISATILSSLPFAILPHCI